MPATATSSPKRERADPPSSAASQSQSTIYPAGQQATTDERSHVQLEAMSSDPDKHVVDKLDGLFAGIEDTNEKLRLLSKAIDYLQQMRTHISQAG